MPSLHEIEKTMSRLWLDSQARAWLCSETEEDTYPSELAALNQVVLSELDRRGASVYARSINYEYQDMADCIFPYCAKAVGESWNKLVSDYYKHYPSSHFDFNKICLHFSEYLTKHCSKLLEKYPYLAELANYEWLEHEKYEDSTKIERALSIQINGIEQITEYFPIVNQTLSVRHYQFPIVEIANNFGNRKRPRKKFAKSPCILAIYRDPDTHRTRFIQLGIASAAVIEMAQCQPSTYQDLLKLTLSLTPELSPAQAVVEFLTLLEELQNDNIFIGSNKKR